MFSRRRMLGAILVLAPMICVSAAGLSRAHKNASAGKREEERLNLDQARVYLLELVNKDRAVLGRPPVQFDAIATAVGQKQAEQMVRMAAMSHSDMQGRLPVQRYTEAGGLDRVQENVSVLHVKKQLETPLELDPAPCFTRSEIEAIEAGYFNEIPPNDGHRKNILRTEHTHIGVGLARGKGDDSGVIGTAQEFVDRYFDQLSALPEQVVVGASVTLRGKLSRGRRLRALAIARDPEPSALDRSQFRSYDHYSVPAPSTKLRIDDLAGAAKLAQAADGSFTASAKVGEDGQPGLYYLSLWVDEPGSGEVLASVRTMHVNAVRPVASGGGGSAGWKP